MAKAIIRTHTTTLLELTEEEHKDLQQVLESYCENTNPKRNVKFILHQLQTPTYEPKVKEGN
jgi:predicted enzyme involved in methoxymalonyl-ACP biosynthesis